MGGHREAKPNAADGFLRKPPTGRHMKSSTKLSISVALNAILMVVLLAMFIRNAVISEYYQMFAGTMVRRAIEGIERGKYAEVSKVLKSVPSQPAYSDLVAAAQALGSLDETAEDRHPTAPSAPSPPPLEK